MPADLQAVLLGDPAAESASGRAGVRALESELLETITAMGKTVVELTPEQKATFAAKTQSTHQQFLSDNPELQGLYDQVQAKLNSMR